MCDGEIEKCAIKLACEFCNFTNKKGSLKPVSALLYIVTVMLTLIGLGKLLYKHSFKKFSFRYLTKPNLSILAVYHFHVAF